MFDHSAVSQWVGLPFDASRASKGLRSRFVVLVGGFRLVFSGEVRGLELGLDLAEEGWHWG